MSLIRPVLLLALAAATVTYAPPGATLSYVMMRDVDLLQQSGGVATFQVEDIAQAKSGDRETRYRLRRIESLSGNAAGETEILALPGTSVPDGDSVIVPGIPALQKGQRLLLFFERGHDGVLRSVHLTLGLFIEIESGKDAFYVRSLDPGSDAARGKNIEYNRPRLARKFERALREFDARDSLPADYFPNHVDAEALEKFNLAMVMFAGGNPPTGPGRWFQFDDGTDVDWYAQPDPINPSPAVDEYAALQTSLAAWNNDPGSKVVLTYAGIGTAPGTTGTGNIYWNDNRPGGPVVPGTYSCGSGGILGVGGSSASSPARVFQAQNWYVRFNAFVIINDGVACAFDTFAGTFAAQTITHEIGHTLGFAHSCGDAATGTCTPGSLADQAIMRASLHADARGGSLGVDDIAGLAVVYPETNVANLSIGTLVNPGSARPGETVTLTHSINNAGPGAASTVSVTISAAADLDFISNTGNCTTPFPCNLGTLASGVSRTITSTYRIASDHPGGGTLAATTTVASGTPDPSGANNSALASVTVLPRSANLAVTLSDGGASVVAGSWIVFNLGISNAGPSDASSLSLSYPLPADTSFASASGGGWNCSVASGTVTCTRASLAAGASAPLTLMVDVDSPYGGPNPISSTVNLSAATSDPASGNNNASDTTPVQVPDPNGVFCNGFELTACIP
jgi:uncharacterized repeat protein (TIGR01451 family)